MQTIAGNFNTSREVNLREILLPEFDKTKRIDGITAYVFDAPCQYNMIIGRDFLCKAKINLNFEHGFMEWLETRIAMKATTDWDPAQSVQEYFTSVDDAAEDELD
eukprot:15333638-Ditylum_brightwellii.AAC.1